MKITAKITYKNELIRKGEIIEMMVVFSILSRDWNSEMLSEIDQFYLEGKYELIKYMRNPQDYESKHFRLEIVEIRIMSKV